MRNKTSLLLTLMLFSPAIALTIDVSSDQTNLNINNEFSIYYLIELNQPTNITYRIGLIDNDDLTSNLTIYENAGLVQELSSSIIHNITNTKAGSYILFLEVKGDLINIVEPGPEDVIINPYSNYTIKVFENLYVLNESGNDTITIYNAGNTELSISSYFTNAQSEMNIYPQSFLLEPNQTRNLIVIAGRPEEDYTAKLNLIAQNDNYSSTVMYNVNVVIPIINLTLDNVAQSQDDNTTVTINLTNHGNMPVNATLMIRTFTIAQGFNTYSYDVSAPAGELTTLSYTLPLSTVVSATIVYEGFNGTVERKIELSSVDRIPFSLTQDQMLLITIVGLIVIVYVYLKLTRKKKFR